jgi:glucosylceramidase
MRTAWWAPVIGVLVCLAGSVSIARLRDDRGSAALWITTSDGRLRLARQRDVPQQPALPHPTIRILENQRRQAMLGFGASLTESAAELIRSLTAAKRRRLLDDLFLPTSGIGLNYIRVAVGSSDYVASLPFEAFDLARDERAVLPILRAAKRRNPRIRIIATPWSAPSAMKDSRRLEGGSLRQDALDAYADYLVEFVRAYARAGIRVDDLTVQNEPKLATTYPSMTMTPDQQAALMQALDAKLTAAGLGTRLFAFDHNWEDPGYPLEVFAKARGVRRLEGAAFHCYAGEPEQLAEIRAMGKRVLETECSGIDSGSTTFGDTLRWQVEHLIIRGPRAGAETAMTWNLALDAHGGPEHGTCAMRCNGVVEIADGRYRRNAEYYVLAHASRFVGRGARQIASQSAPTSPLKHVAFRNPDGAFVAIILNAGDRAMRFTVGEGDRSFAATLPPGAVGTFSWD